MKNFTRRPSRGRLEADLRDARAALAIITKDADTRLAAAAERLTAAEIHHSRLGDIARAWQARTLQLEAWRDNHVCTPAGPLAAAPALDPLPDPLADFYRISTRNLDDDLPDLFAATAVELGAPAGGPGPTGPVTRSWSLAAAQAASAEGEARRARALVDDQADFTTDPDLPGGDVDEQTVAIPAGGVR